ncbi:MAG: HgcAB-like fusion protein, partial [Candidatus Heimdallarchaeaceae archaeon]
MKVGYWISYIFFNILETLLRFFPVPIRTGIIEIGKPNPQSPVLITGNYHLTVLRVKRALSGLNCYLLVANSKGINIWCAAAGGHFTTHDVISILKTSGIDKLVEHRRVILPQLAAVSIEPRIIRGKTEWKPIWGPVYAKDIKEFLANEFKKEAFMREV